MQQLTFFFNLMLVLLLTSSAYAEIQSSSGYKWNQLLYRQGSDANFIKIFLNVTNEVSSDNFEQHSRIVLLTTDNQIITTDLLTGITSSLLDKAFGDDSIKNLLFLGEQNILWATDGFKLYSLDAAQDKALHNWKPAWIGTNFPLSSIQNGIVAIADGALGIFFTTKATNDEQAKIIAYDPFQMIVLKELDIPDDLDPPAMNAFSKLLFTFDAQDDTEAVIAFNGQYLFYYTKDEVKTFNLTENVNGGDVLLYRTNTSNLVIASLMSSDPIGWVKILELQGPTNIDYDHQFPTNVLITKMIIGINDAFHDALYVGTLDGDVYELDLVHFMLYQWEARPEDIKWKLLTSSFGPLKNSQVKFLFSNVVVLPENMVSPNDDNIKPVLIVGRDNGMISMRQLKSNSWQLLGTAALTDLGLEPSIEDVSVVPTNFSTSDVENEKRLLFMNRYGEAYIFESGNSQAWTFMVETPSLSSMQYMHKTNPDNALQMDCPTNDNMGILSFYSLKFYVDVNQELILTLTEDGEDPEELKLNLIGYVTNSQKERSDIQDLIVKNVENEGDIRTIRYSQLFNYDYQDSLWIYEKTHCSD